jgi:outer membrane protein assembly factor BamB
MANGPRAAIMRPLTMQANFTVSTRLREWVQIAGTRVRPRLRTEPPPVAPAWIVGAGLRAAVAAIVILVTASAAGQEWTRFRGPNGTGISPGTGSTIPSQWTKEDVNWKRALPGAGHSSPVIWGERVFVMSADADQGQVSGLCVNAGDGSITWQKRYAFAAFKKHNFNTFASSTPAVDAQHVYVSWAVPARLTLAALDHAGREVWSRDLGPHGSEHGGGTSPIVHDGCVILANEHDGDSFVIAVDAATGRTRWQTPRRRHRASYSTPCLFTTAQGRLALVCNSQSHGVYALDAADGTPLWEYAGAFDKRSVSSPVIVKDLILGSCGSGQGGNYLVAVQTGNPTTGAEPKLAFQIRRSAPYVPTSLALGDLIFLWSDAGVVSCLQAPSGEIRWQERVGGDYFASPVCVGNRLFGVSALGEVVVLAATNRFEILGRNPLGETTHSSPAVAGGRMYIHTASHLISVGGSKSTSAPR